MCIELLTLNKFVDLDIEIDKKAEYKKLKEVKETIAAIYARNPLNLGYFL